MLKKAVPESLAYQVAGGPESRAGRFVSVRATNVRLSLMFHRLADRLEIAGGTPFQVQAYNRFADWVATLGEPLYGYWAAGQSLAVFPGIGKALAAKLDSLFRCGTFPLLERLEQEVPESQLELLHIRGLGPVRVRALAEQIAVRDIEQLRGAVEAGRLAEVDGFGERTGSRVRRSLYEYLSHRGRRLRFQCEGPLELLARHLGSCPAAASVHAAGSYRRGMEDVANLDVFVVTSRPEEVAACLADFEVAEILEVKIQAPPGTPVRPAKRLITNSLHPRPEPSSSAVARVIERHEQPFEPNEEPWSAGGTSGRAGDEQFGAAELPRVRLRFDSGLVADIRLCPPQAAGAALAWHTGSRAHNARLSQLAADARLAYGPTGLSSETGPTDTRDETVFYRILGLPFIPPELREDRGEIEAAREGRLPRLVTREDLVGDLHIHTQASDGSGSILEMALAARALGHRYIAVTDHTQNVRIANGLTPERAAALLDEVRRVDGQVEGIRILAGLEVDILKDGSLDMPEEILNRLDVAIASIHSHFDQPLDEMTARVLAALENPHIHILAHPTGRLIGQRSPLQLDMDRVFDAAVRNRVALELNSNPERLDLNDEHCRMAARLGIPVVISTDAHSPAQLGNLSRGVLQARRGGLEPGHIVNTRGWEEASAVLRRRRSWDE